MLCIQQWPPYQGHALILSLLLNLNYSCQKVKATGINPDSLGALQPSHVYNFKERLVDIEQQTLYDAAQKLIPIAYYQGCWKWLAIFLLQQTLRNEEPSHLGSVTSFLPMFSLENSRQLHMKQVSVLAMAIKDRVWPTYYYTVIFIRTLVYLHQSNA